MASVFFRTITLCSSSKLKAIDLSKMNCTAHLMHSLALLWTVACTEWHASVYELTSTFLKIARRLSPKLCKEASLFPSYPVTQGSPQPACHIGHQAAPGRSRSVAFSGNISRELDLRWSSQDPNQHPFEMLTVNGGIIYYVPVHKEVILFFIKKKKALKFIIYLKAEREELGGDRQRQTEIFHLLLHCPNDHPSWGWVRPSQKPRVPLGFPT